MKTKLNPQFTEQLNYGTTSTEDCGKIFDNKLRPGTIRSARKRAKIDFKVFRQPRSHLTRGRWIIFNKRATREKVSRGDIWFITRINRITVVPVTEFSLKSTNIKLTVDTI